LIERARLRSIKVIGGTLLPFENALAGGPNQGYLTPDKEAKRLAGQSLDQDQRRLRWNHRLSTVLLPTRPVPAAMAAPYDSGDHLHPNDVGYRAMGESVDLKLFQ